MKIKILTVFLVFFGIRGYSQILPYTTQIFDQKFSIVPALAGTDDYTAITITSQKQWLGMERSPYTFILGTNFKLGNFDFYRPDGLLNKSIFKNRDRTGFGFQIYSDQAGYLRNSGANITYAHHLPVSRGRVSFGFSLKFSQMYFQNDQLNPHQPNDPLVPEFNETNYFLNSNIGIGYYETYNFYLGLSADNLFRPIDKIQKEIEIPGYNNRRFYLLGGKYFQFSKSKTLEPFFILSSYGREDFKSVAGFRYFYRKGSWISLVENGNFNSIQGNVGLLIRKITYCLGYSYYTSAISKYQKGSVEFSIVARIGDLTKIRIY
jgi:type IX secretion system PorP/SprF family membrane protein